MGEILDSIKSGLSYHRGTYVSYIAGKFDCNPPTTLLLYKSSLKIIVLSCECVSGAHTQVIMQSIRSCCYLTVRSAAGPWLCNKALLMIVELGDLNTVVNEKTKELASGSTMKLIGYERGEKFPDIFSKYEHHSGLTGSLLEENQ